MKVLLINDTATPIAGSEIMSLTLRDGLRRRGHDARLFASSARPLPADVLADYRCFGTTARSRTLLATANPWAFRQLRRVLAEFRPDVVHVRMFLTQLSPLILPLLRRVPSLEHVVNYKPICPLGTKLLPNGTTCRVRAGPACYANRCLPLHAWIPLMLQLRLYRDWRGAFDLTVANSEAVRRRLLADGIRPVEMVRNGVRSRPPRPPLSAPPTVAYAGRLVPEKGVDVLLHAFARVARRMPEARLLLAGEGAQGRRVRELIPELGLSPRVCLLGQLPRSEVERAFDAAWVQAVPTRLDEPFANVATEAMMRGTAVVASGSGSLVEIVRHGQTGLLVRPGDADALAEALLVLLGDRQLAERMGRAGRDVALTHFSEAAWLDQFLNVYRSIAGPG
jgi:glycosyltransferase involved in cell wall biosynthesis